MLDSRTFSMGQGGRGRVEHGKRERRANCRHKICKNRGLEET